MRTRRLVRQLGAGALALALASGLFFSFFRVVPTTHYTSETMIRLPWGRGEVAAGVGVARDGRLHGPQGFDVDRGGRVFLADTANGRILAFDDRGVLFRVFPLPGARGGAATSPLAGRPRPDLVAVDDDGTVYVADNGRREVLALDPLGRQRASYRLGAGRGIFRVEALVAGGGRAYGILWEISRERSGRALVQLVKPGVEDDGWGKVRRLGGLEQRPGIQLPPERRSLAGRLDAVAVVGGAKGAAVPAAPVPHSLAVGPGGRLLVEAVWPGTLERLVVPVDARGRPGRPMPLELPGEAPRQAALAGVDARGSIYLAVNPGGRGGRLVRLDAHGRPLWTGNAPWRGEVQLLVGARADAGGNLYVLHPAPGGLTIDRLTLDHGWRLAPR